MDFFRFAISSTQVNKNEWKSISTAKSHKKLTPFLEDERKESAILKVPIAEADHVRTGWWIDFWWIEKYFISFDRREKTFETSREND